MHTSVYLFFYKIKLFFFFFFKRVVSVYKYLLLLYTNTYSLVFVSKIVSEQDTKDTILRYTHVPVQKASNTNDLRDARI
jgi:hypothetical protein